MISVKTRKLLAVLLCIVMVAAFFAGCSGDAKPSGNQGGNTPANNNNGEPTPITIFFQDDNVNFPQNMDRPTMQTVAAIAKEKFNLDISIETAISSEMESAVNTRLVSGSSNMPDILCYDFAIQRVVELYQQGLVLGLTDLIKEHAPEIKYRMMERYPAIAIACSTNDGEILRIPNMEESIQHEVYVSHIRYDWLKELGLEVPTTPDEFFDTFKAFRDNDMNGNGRADEVFMPGSVITYSDVFCTAFDVPKLMDSIRSWAVDDNGKIYNTMITDNAKAFAEYSAKLVEAGILDVEFTNQTADTINTKRFNNIVGGTTGSWWDSVILDTQLAEKVPGVEYIPMEPLISASGDQFILRRNNVGWSNHMLTAACKDPVGCIKLLDWCWTKEGTQILYFGEAAPGGDYYETPKDVPEGIVDIDYQLVYTEKGTKEMAEEPELWAKMGWNQTAFLPQYFESGVDCVALEFYTAFGTDACGKAAEVEFNKTHLNRFINDIGRFEVSFATPTSEQIEELNKYDDLWIYMDETFTNFLLGRESFDKWQDFVDQCNALGLQDAIAKVFQPRYDAYVKILESMK